MRCSLIIFLTVLLISAKCYSQLTFQADPAISNFANWRGNYQQIPLSLSKYYEVNLDGRNITTDSTRFWIAINEIAVYFYAYDRDCWVMAYAGIRERTVEDRLSCNVLLYPVQVPGKNTKGFWGNFYDRDMSWMEECVGRVIFGETNDFMIVSFFQPTAVIGDVDGDYKKTVLDVYHFFHAWFNNNSLADWDHDKDFDHDDLYLFIEDWQSFIPQHN